MKRVNEETITEGYIGLREPIRDDEAPQGLASDVIHYPSWV